RLCFFSQVIPPTATCTLSLHDALPICVEVCPTLPRTVLVHQPRGPIGGDPRAVDVPRCGCFQPGAVPRQRLHPRPERDEYGVEVDRKSTRLNSSHVKISYAVFCLKKKK